MTQIVVFDEYGGPDVLHVREVDDPQPGAGEVRIRVRAAGIQPFDARFRSGAFARFQPASFPARLGNEAAGVVDALGPGTDGVRVGDEVIAFLDATGYADAVTAPVTHVAPKPDGMSWAEAGVLSASGQTAHTALDALGVGPGDCLLVHAAAGGVGSFAVQLAVARGATVVGTASARNHDYLAGLGAIPVTYGPGLADRVRDAAPSPITAALDAVGGEANDVSIELLGSPERAITLVDREAEQRLGIRRVGTDRSADRLAALTAAWTAGALVVPAVRTFTLQDAPDAHREIETGHVRGKIALVPA